MDPHIFADPDPDPGSQNLADPTDPDRDTKHCLAVVEIFRQSIIHNSLSNRSPSVLVCQ